MIVARLKTAERLLDVTCQTTDLVGDLVYVFASNKVVKKADVGDYFGMPAIGIIINKVTTTRALVQIAGLVKGLYTDLQPGRLYFVGSDSRPSYLPPMTPMNRFVQPIGTALDTSVLFLQPNTHMTKIRD